MRVMTLSRYHIQRRDYSRTLNSGGYPDGPYAWGPWGLVVDFEDRQRAINIGSQLQDLAGYAANEHHRRRALSNFRVIDSETGEEIPLNPPTQTFNPVKP